MSIQYNSQGHVENVSVGSASEARLVIHELNLKKNEYAATLQRINEQLAIAQPKSKSAPLAKMLGAFSRNAAHSPVEPWLRQLQERKVEFEQHVQDIDERIAKIQSMVAERAKAV